MPPNILASCRSISKPFTHQPCSGTSPWFFTPGERLGLIGPNGSGKSSLMRLLMGNLPPDAGQIKRGDGLALMGTVEISFSTITDNNEEGIILINQAHLRLKNSIVAGHTSSNIDSATYAGGGTSTDLGGNYVGDSPLLGPLADNGGPTLTRLPQNGSPAIDLAVDCTDAAGTAVTEDQRGEHRPHGPACDAGAVEAQYPFDDPIPTLTEWGALLLAVLLGGGMLWQRLRQADPV